jgi:mono/diheme cytochrome c family protein
VALVSILSLFSMILGNDKQARNPKGSVSGNEIIRREWCGPDEVGDNTLPLPLLACFAVVLLVAGCLFGASSGNFSGDVYEESQSHAGRKLGGVSGASVGGGGPAQESLVEIGKGVFSNCVPCHQASGLGVANQFPPLVKSDFVVGSEKRLIAILLKGVSGPLVVNGASFNGQMVGWESTLSNKKLAAVASYIRSAWGNGGAEISEAKVAAVRNELSERKSSWSESELLAMPKDGTIEVSSTSREGDVGAAPKSGDLGSDTDLAKEGKAQYSAICVACHQPSGLGLPGIFPPLVGSEYVSGSSERLIAIILHGVSGPISVDGKIYNNVMPAQGSVLNDTKIAQVASFVRSNFGSGASQVLPSQVAVVREKYKERSTPWTESELKAFGN